MFWIVPDNPVEPATLGYARWWTLPTLLTPLITYLARPAGLEPATLGLAYQLRLSTPHRHCVGRVCGLDYLFTISGVARIVSTDPRNFARITGFLGIAIGPAQ